VRSKERKKRRFKMAEKLEEFERMIRIIVESLELYDCKDPTIGEVEEVLKNPTIAELMALEINMARLEKGQHKGRRLNPKEQDYTRQMAGDKEGGK
jgi:hypothetical protein